MNQPHRMVKILLLIFRMIFLTVFEAEKRNGAYRIIESTLHKKFVELWSKFFVAWNPGLFLEQVWKEHWWIPLNIFKCITDPNDILGTPKNELSSRLRSHTFGLRKRSYGQHKKVHSKSDLNALQFGDPWLIWEVPPDPSDPSGGPLVPPFFVNRVSSATRKLAQDKSL